MNLNPSNHKSIQAIFLDRDGVIIHNRADYVRRWEDVHFYPSSLRALQMINRLQDRPKVFLITNQSAIGRGLISVKQYLEINQKILEVIVSSGGFIDQVFFCPHAPEENCDCRKPKPGMIFQAAHQYAIDLRETILIGDALSDIEAGYLGDIPNLYLVATGRGKKQYKAATTLTYYKQIQFHKNLLSVIKTIF